MSLENDQTAILWNELNEKKKQLEFYEQSREKINKDYYEIEPRMEILKQTKAKFDKELAESKNEEALLQIDIKDIIDSSNVNTTKQLNETLNVFSVVGTDNDVLHNDFRIAELTKKVNDLEDEVRTTRNDRIMCKREIDEIAYETNEIAEKHALYSNDIVVAETKISQLKIEKQNLTIQQDDLRQKLMETEMKKGTKGVMDRGAEGFSQYDAYIKQIRMRIIEAREQKRQAELQLIDISQRLNSKRLRQEIAEKNRVTDATIAMMEEICNQFSFLGHLETCIEAFIEQIGNGYSRNSFLQRTTKFSSLFSMFCDSICAVISKVPAAHDSIAVLC